MVERQSDGRSKWLTSNANSKSLVHVYLLYIKDYFRNPSTASRYATIVLRTVRLQQTEDRLRKILRNGALHGWHASQKTPTNKLVKVSVFSAIPRSNCWQMINFKTISYPSIWHQGLRQKPYRFTALNGRLSRPWIHHSSAVIASTLRRRLCAGYIREHFESYCSHFRLSLPTLLFFPLQSSIIYKPLKSANLFFSYLEWQSMRKSELRMTLGSKTCPSRTSWTNPPVNKPMSYEMRTTANPSYTSMSMKST